MQTTLKNTTRHIVTEIQNLNRHLKEGNLDCGDGDTSDGDSGGTRQETNCLSDDNVDHHTAKVRRNCFYSVRRIENFVTRYL